LQPRSFGDESKPLVEGLLPIFRGIYDIPRDWELVGKPGFVLTGVWASDVNVENAGCVQFDALYCIERQQGGGGGQASRLARFVVGFDEGSGKVLPRVQLVEWFVMDESVTFCTSLRAGREGEFYLTWSNRRTVYVHLSSADGGGQVTVPFSPPCHMAGAQVFWCVASGRVVVLSMERDRVYVMDYLRPLEEWVVR
jgi:hypothetical protein